MHRRATSKKRAAEAEKEIDMEDKEVTPVEDVELILPPAEPTEQLSQGKQPDNPTQTGDVNFQETVMRMMMEMREDNKSVSRELKEELGQKMEENSKKAEENSKKMEEKMDCLLYTSRCV